MNNLDTDEIGNVRSKKEKIIENCKKLNLPLHVQSSAVNFWSKHPKHSIESALSLACKATDSHDSRTEADDEELAELLEYNFHQPCPYLRMYGFIVMLQERSLIDKSKAEKLWSEGIKNIEKLIVMENQWDVNSMAVAAIDLSVEVFKVFDIEVEKVLNLKNKLVQDKNVINY